MDGNSPHRHTYSYFNYMMRPDPRNFLPFKPVDLELLLALAEAICMATASSRPSPYTPMDCSSRSRQPLPTSSGDCSQKD